MDFQLRTARLHAAVLTCVTVGLVAGCGPSGSQPADPARAVVDRAIAAHGGVESWIRLENVRWRETVTRFSEPLGTSTRTIYVKKPTHGRPMVRIEQEGGTIEHVDEQYDVESPRISGSLVIGHDGAEAWYERDGVLDTSAHALRSARYVTQAFLYWFSLPFKLVDPGVRLRLLEPDTQNDEMRQRVEVTFEPGTGDTPTDRFVYVFDEHTGRIRDIHYWRVGRADRPRLGQWREYVEVGGVWKESQRVFFDARTMARNTERRFDYDVQSSLPDDLFRPGYQPPPSAGGR